MARRLEVLRAIRQYRYDVPWCVPKWGPSELRATLATVLHGAVVSGSAADAGSLAGLRSARVGRELPAVDRLGVRAFGRVVPSKVELLLLVVRMCRSLARALVARMLPARLKRPLRIWRDLAPGARKAYALRRLSSQLPRRSRREQSFNRLCRRITFVCHGNIMRSAFAAVLLEAELRRLGIEGFSVTSCGTDAQSGRPADRRAITLAREFGVGLERHLASRVTRTTIDESDVVIAMDFVNEAKLIAAFPDASRKILILPRAPRERGPVEIPDPYDGNVDDVRACFDVVHQRVNHLVSQLAQVHSIPNGSAKLTTPLPAAGG